MPEPRYLPHVIDRVLDEIPRNAAARPRVEPKLRTIQEAARYTAPECAASLWYATGLVLASELGPAVADWRLIVREIVEGKRP